MTRDTGVLPDVTIEELINNGHITGVDTSFINPSSLDLPLAPEAYQLDHIFQPNGLHISTILDRMGAQPHHLPNRLEVGVPYIIKIAGNYRLPESVYSYANPKSSTGRLNLITRIVADGADMYDHVPAGFSGDVWALVRPDSFPITLSPGQAITQLRFFDGKAFLDPLHLEFAVNRTGLVFQSDGKKLALSDMRIWGDAVMLSLSVGDVFGYECRPGLKTLDFGLVGAYRSTDYFEAIQAPEGYFKLRKDGFYILSTREHVLVPPGYAAELRAIDPRLGDFRSHAAGFIDAGWGFGKDGAGRGRPITLEVIPFEDMYVQDGQPIARLRFEHMKQPPRAHYDQVASHYLGQIGPRLSKHFLEE